MRFGYATEKKSMRMNIKTTNSLSVKRLQFLYPSHPPVPQNLPFLAFLVSPVWKLCSLETLGSSLSTVKYKINDGYLTFVRWHSEPKRLVLGWLENFRYIPVRISPFYCTALLAFELFQLSTVNQNKDTRNKEQNAQLWTVTVSVYVHAADN